MSDKIKLELTEEDVDRFQRFMKHYDLWKLLVDNGILELEKAEMILSIGDKGIITKIDHHKNTYKRRAFDNI